MTSQQVGIVIPKKELSEVGIDIENENSFHSIQRYLTMMRLYLK